MTAFKRVAVLMGGRRLISVPSVRIGRYNPRFSSRNYCRGWPTGWK